MLEVRTFSPTDERFLEIVDRAADFDNDIGVTVANIIADVRTGGGEALLKYVRQFDAPLPDEAALRVTPEEIAAARSQVSPEFMEAIRDAVANIRRFHEPQIRKSYSVEFPDSVVLSKRVLPISRVGVYCPAGTAPLFSSMMMNTVPAQLAGVREIAVAIPPRKDGSISPHMLAVADYLGLKEIYKMGGAHAIAAFTHGAGVVGRVDKIVGPGNAYVAMAKRQVFGLVGIDSVAGPSEIVIIADRTANPRYIAADLLSQVEHGSGYESGVVFTDDRALADGVAAETAALLSRLERSDAIERALSRYGAVYVCRDLDEALAAANVVAPEHLEIQTENPERLLAMVLNAGAVFLGPWSTEPIGDYFAGTNHVLPTTGAARFSSGLGVADFQKDMSVIRYTRDRLKATGDKVITLAEGEFLTAHAHAVRVRMDDIRDK